MSVYDSANKLASEIRASKEYKDFVENMKNMKSDKNNEYLLNHAFKEFYSFAVFSKCYISFLP